MASDTLKAANSTFLSCSATIVSSRSRPSSLYLTVMPQAPILTSFAVWKNLSLKCSLGFSPPPVDPIWGPFLVEKEYGQTANPLQCKGFPICPYYAIRAYLRYIFYAKSANYRRLFTYLLITSCTLYIIFVGIFVETSQKTYFWLWHDISGSMTAQIVKSVICCLTITFEEKARKKGGSVVK